jgi:uroporphyrin-III C-methyltransferase / precorrin-2 dehydrogenase / sirohydrochlorin ferrochelatase
MSTQDQVKRLPRIRPPRETAARMGDLATLPVFLKLRGKQVLLAGGSGGTAWKAELLAAAGAHVHLVWNEPDAETIKLAAEWPDRVRLITRTLEEADFDGMAVAIGALEDDQEGAHFAATARAKGIPVNVVDRPAFCDFQLGAIVNRSPLVIGISTDGGAPPLGQAIRSMIETMLPQGFARWAQAAKNWRGRVMGAGLDGADRKAFWRRFASEAMRRPNDAPCPVEREAMIADLEHRDAARGKGHLALVGAGPGDPELLTLKAVRYLREADVILYDDLVSDGVLAFGRREARKIHVGKRGGEASCAQTDITSLAVLLAEEGNRVVRLKGGDPLIFGRADEELAAAETAGVEIAIVNGISAAQGAAAALGQSLTRRGVARRLQFVTAHAETGDLPTSIDWATVADPDVTTCLYMGRRNLREFLHKAFRAGLDPATPARFVLNATLPSQHVISAEVRNIVELVEVCERKGPGVLLMGHAFDVAVVKPQLKLAAE